MIRRARPEDAEAVVRIFRESRAEAMPWLPVLHTFEEDVGFFRRALGGEAYMIEVDVAVAGFIVLRDDELDALYVAPGLQRRGVGSALLARAKEERPDGFRFWVFQENGRARRFYEARGCRLIRETDGAATKSGRRTPSTSGRLRERKREPQRPGTIRRSTTCPSARTRHERRP